MSYKLSAPRSLGTRGHMQGMTLVEVMIAMVIGLIILGAMSNVLINNLRTSGEIEKVGRQIENGRFALQFMVDDISNAGFFGGARMAGAVEVLDFCDTSEAHERILLPALAIEDVAPGACTPNVKDDTQVLIVRRFSTSSRPTTDIQDCPEKMTCVQVNPVGEPTFTAGPMEIRIHNNNDFAAVYIPVMNIYYVDTSDRLRLTSLTWDAGEATTKNEILVEGIEMLNFQQDGTRITINLLARSETATPGLAAEERSYAAFSIGGEPYTTNDSIRRHFYSVAVNVYNPTN
jgi:type IV pilus assembly protein PilW